MWGNLTFWKTEHVGKFKFWSSDSSMQFNTPIPYLLLTLYTFSGRMRDYGGGVGNQNLYIIEFQSIPQCYTSAPQLTTNVHHKARGTSTLHDHWILNYQLVHDWFLVSGGQPPPCTYLPFIVVFGLPTLQHECHFTSNLRNGKKLDACSIQQSKYW